MTWDFQQCGMCDQQSLRSTCAYTQSDQSLCLSLEYSMRGKLHCKCRCFDSKHVRKHLLVTLWKHVLVFWQNTGVLILNTCVLTKHVYNVFFFENSNTRFGPCYTLKTQVVKLFHIITCMYFVFKRVLLHKHTRKAQRHSFSYTFPYTQ